MSENVKSNEEYMIYLDNLGRLMMGKKILDECNEQTIAVKNPLTIHITPTSQGGINVQFFPTMFREFQADRNSATIWDIPRQNVTLVRNITLDARLIGQYESMFAPIKDVMPMGGMPSQQITQQPKQEEVKVLKLFDE